MKRYFIYFSLSVLLLIFGLTACNNQSQDTISYLPCVPFLDTDEGFQYMNVLDVNSGKFTEINNAENIVSSSMFCGDWATIAIELENSNRFYNFVNSKGKMLNDSLYKWATVMSDGRAWVVSQGGHITLINESGKEVKVIPELHTAYPFFEGKSIAYHAEKGWIVVNKSGQEIAIVPYQPIAPFVINNTVIVEKEQEKEYYGGVYVLNSKEQPEIIYDDIEISSDNNSLSDVIKGLKDKKLLVKKDRKWGVMDITGEIIINPQFSELRFDGKNYMFEKDHSWGWCSASGEYIINPQYSKVRGFNGTKLAPARELHSYDWGYVDTKGNWVIAPQFKNAYSFNNYGLAIAKIGDDWGIINQKGKWVINPQYDFVYELKGTNQYIVSMDNEKSYMIINAKNEMVSNEQFVLDTEALINWEESIGYHMLENYGGVKTDYVDFSLVGDMLIEMAVSMQSTTSGAIKEKLGERVFKNGEVTLDKIDEEQFVLTLKADCNPWKRVSDGWFGYKNIFKSDCVINRYKMILELEGNATDKYGALIAYLTKNFDYDEESSSLVIGNKNFVLHTNKKQTVITFTLMSGK